MRFKQILLLFYTTALACGMVSCSVSARVKRADKKYHIGEYYAAADMYKQVYKQISSKDKKLRAHVAFHQGECYRILNNSKAVSAYKNAARYRYQDSIVYLRYAQVLQYQGEQRLHFLPSKTTSSIHAETPLSGKRDAFAKTSPS